MEINKQANANREVDANQEADARKEAERIRLKSCCSSCGKPIESKSGSLSSWIFRNATCHCATKLIVDSERTIGSDKRGAVPDARALGLPERYEILALLGQGGMGSVYKVTDTSIGQTLAVKVLRAELAADSAHVKRLEEEISTTAGLDHANLVAVYEHGLTSVGAPYVVLEFVEGQSLAQLLQREVFLDIARAIDIFIQLGEGMAHAHSRGVVHRDLKPGNVLIGRNGDADVVKIADFGIAKMEAVDHTQPITQTDDAFGTPLYMSPEQCSGGALDNRCDIYSLGCLMYECVTSKPPFLSENPVKTVLKHLYESPPSISANFKQLDISPDLETIILHCLEKSPDNRYQYMEEVMKDLQQVRDGDRPAIARQQQKKRGNSLSKYDDFTAGQVFAMIVLVFFCADVVSLGYWQSLAALLLLYGYSGKVAGIVQWSTNATKVYAILGLSILAYGWHLLSFDGASAVEMILASLIALVIVAAGAHCIVLGYARFMRQFEVRRIIGSNKGLLWMDLLVFTVVCQGLFLVFIGMHDLVYFNRIPLFLFSESLVAFTPHPPAWVSAIARVLIACNLVFGALAVAKDLFVRSEEPLSLPVK